MLVSFVAASLVVNTAATIAESIVVVVIIERFVAIQFAEAEFALAAEEAEPEVTSVIQESSLGISAA